MQVSQPQVIVCTALLRIWWLCLGEINCRTPTPSNPMIASINHPAGQGNRRRVRSRTKEASMKILKLMLFIAWLAAIIWVGFELEKAPYLLG